MHTLSRQPANPIEARFCVFEIQGDAVHYGPWAVDQDGTITGPYDKTERRSGLGHVNHDPSRTKPWSYWLNGVHTHPSQHPEFATRDDAIRAALMHCAGVFGGGDKAEIDEIVVAYIEGKDTDRSAALQCIADVLDARPDMFEHATDAIGRIFAADGDIAEAA